MPRVTFKAHFDGEHIVLDEPFPLAPNTQLMVTILRPASQQVVNERDAFSEAAARELSRAYGPNEPEYTAAASGTISAVRD